jgi:hypothetical protein
LPEAEGGTPREMAWENRIPALAGRRTPLWLVDQKGLELVPVETTGV